MLLFPTLWFIFLLGKHLRFQDELILTMVNAIALSLVAFIVDASFQGVCHYSSAETCVQDSGFVYLALLVMFPLFFENVAGIVNLFIWANFYIGTRALLTQRLDWYITQRRRICPLMALVTFIVIVIPYIVLVIVVSEQRSFHALLVY